MGLIFFEPIMPAVSGVIGIENHPVFSRRCGNRVIGMGGFRVEIKDKHQILANKGDDFIFLMLEEEVGFRDFPSDFIGREQMVGPGQMDHILIQSRQIMKF